MESIKERFTHSMSVLSMAAVQINSKDLTVEQDSLVHRAMVDLVRLVDEKKK